MSKINCSPKNRKFNFFDQNLPKNGAQRSQINFWSKNENFKFSTKNQFLVKKSEVQFFDQNLPKNGAQMSQIDFWSKNETIKFSTKNEPWRSEIDFWSKNQKFHFSTKICPKIMPRGLRSIFGREMKISIFRPKMDPGGQKSIFGQKIKNSIFDQNLPKNGVWRPQINFWSKNKNFKFSTKYGP